MTDLAEHALRVVAHVEGRRQHANASRSGLAGTIERSWEQGSPTTSEGNA